MLSACADGENRYIESMCQTIFSIDELLHVLADEHIDHIRKAPYLKYEENLSISSVFNVGRFIRCVYLNVSGNAAEIGTEYLFQNVDLWKAIKILCNQELAAYHTAQSPKMSEVEIDFAYDSLLPFLKQVLRDHYRPDLYPASQTALREIQGAVCGFAGLKFIILIMNTSSVLRPCSC